MPEEAEEEAAEEEVEEDEAGAGDEKRAPLIRQPLLWERRSDREAMGWIVRCLGQSGLRIKAGNTVVYVDPYLSDSVRQAEGKQGERLCDPPMQPQDIRDADWILVTHEHLDHLDPATLEPIARSNPRAKFILPAHLVDRIDSARSQGARREWIDLGGDLRVHPFRTSHPKPRDTSPGAPWSVGYVLENDGERVVVTGDTSLTEDLLVEITPFAPFKAAFLPVNERNFMRESAGIIGNMTVREAFWLAEHLQTSVLVAQHWDMFRANSVHREEIELLHSLENPPFDLLLPEGEVVL